MISFQKCPFCEEKLTYEVIVSGDSEESNTVTLRMQTTRESTEHVWNHAPSGMVRQAQAQALRDAAKDTRDRGDIGKDGGCEAWDYLTWRADRIEKGEP